MYCFYNDVFFCGHFLRVNSTETLRYSRIDSQQGQVIGTEIVHYSEYDLKFRLFSNYKPNLKNFSLLISNEGETKDNF